MSSYSANTISSSMSSPSYHFYSNSDSTTIRSPKMTPSFLSRPPLYDSDTSFDTTHDTTTTSNFSANTTSSSMSTVFYHPYSNSESTTIASNPSYNFCSSSDDSSSDHTVTPSDSSTGGTSSYNSGPSEDQMSPDVAKDREQISSHAICLQEEVLQFIEHQVKLNGAKEYPRLPKFFVKSYNYLKKIANELGYEDDVLNSLPNSIKANLIVEFGSSDTFPLKTQNGLLVDNNNQQESTFDTDIQQFISDIIQHVKNSFRIDGYISFLPKSYFTSLKAFEQELIQKEYTEEDIKMFHLMMTVKMQNKLTEALGEQIVDKEFVNKCIRHHNKTLKPSSQFNNLRVDIN